MEEKWLLQLRDSICYRRAKLSEHSSFQIGGEVDYLIDLGSVSDLITALQAIQTHQYPYLIMGKGSNLLFADQGFRGIILKLHQRFQNITLLPNYQVAVSAGVSVKDLALFLAEQQLQGFENLSGIPGTIGGLTFMNGGAYGKEIQDLIVSVTTVDQNCQLQTYASTDLHFAYRYSDLQEKQEIITEVTLQLSPGNRAEIYQNITNFYYQRAKKQPLSFPSAGSVFKRPPNHYASALIDQAGLRGYQIGGAQVSSKHTGFIVNTGTATCQDVLQLIQHIKTTIHQQFHIQLQEEIKIIGGDQ